MTKTDEIDDSSAPLIEHLAELRTRLIYSVMAFIAAMLLCFAFGSTLLKFLLMPIEKSMRALGNENPVMQYTAPQEYFFTLLHISMVGGLVIGFPVIAYQLWRFVAPGLYKTEKNAFRPFLIASPVLFLIGASFAHFVVVPMAMTFFLGYADIPSLVSTLVTGGAEGANSEGLHFVFNGKVNESLDITLKLIVAFGLCFQLPVLLTLMGKAGLASSRGLRRMRRYAVVLIITFAAMVTPPDVMSQLLLFSVVYSLYEISIWLVQSVEKKKDEQAREDGLIGEGESLFDSPDEDDDETQTKA